MLKEGTKKGGRNKGPSSARPSKPPLGLETKESAVDMLSMDPAEFRRLLREHLPEVLPRLIKEGAIRLSIT